MGFTLMPEKQLTYLALGDSYTIGESVPQEQSFPFQVKAMLAQKGIPLTPTVVAKTGWTTDELMKGIEQAPLQPSYDLVSLLIGVNNQYRGWSKDTYRKEFTELLNKAIVFAGGKKSHVVVVSIPDWGQTPFAEGRDRIQIGKEMDAFNAINKEISDQYQITYIEITQGSRDASKDGTLVAGDGLHPSGKEYQKWASKIATYFSTLKF